MGGTQGDAERESGRASAVIVAVTSKPSLETCDLAGAAQVGGRVSCISGCSEKSPSLTPMGNPEHLLRAFLVLGCVFSSIFEKDLQGMVGVPSWVTTGTACRAASHHARAMPCSHHLGNSQNVPSVVWQDSPSDWGQPEH